MSKWKEMVARTTILRCVVGSEAYGLALGKSDRDERGVCVEDFKAANNLSGELDEYVFRTATERTGDKDAKSEAGDLDLTIYSLRKFLKLALQGNPNIIELLFIHGDRTVVWERLGTDLQDLYPAIISKNIGSRYLGYMKGQKARYLGEREGGRAELREKFGYDVKCASHVLRLGIQGIEALTTGKLSLPITGRNREVLLDVKQGKWSIEQVNEACAELENNIKEVMKKDYIREEPDFAVVERFMQQTYSSMWAFHDI